MAKAPKQHVAAAMIAVVAFLGGGCSKSQKPAQEDIPAADAGRPLPSTPEVAGPLVASNALPITDDVRPAGSNALASSGAPDTDEARRVDLLTRDFRAARSFDDRFEAALQIGELGTAQAVSTLEQLFREEQDKDMKVELINALIGITGCKDERLRFLTLGIDASQPAEVREAALDGLVDLEDARALPLIERLFTDPDEDLRTLARQLHDLLQEMLKAEAR